MCAGAAQHPPQYVIVENVVGFEGSSMRKHLTAGLDAAGLDMQVTPWRMPGMSDFFGTCITFP